MGYERRYRWIAVDYCQSRWMSSNVKWMPGLSGRPVLARDGQADVGNGGQVCRFDSKRERERGSQRRQNVLDGVGESSEKIDGGSGWKMKCSSAAQPSRGQCKLIETVSTGQFLPIRAPSLHSTKHPVNIRANVPDQASAPWPDHSSHPNLASASSPRCTMHKIVQMWIPRMTSSAFVPLKLRRDSRTYSTQYVLLLRIQTTYFVSITFLRLLQNTRHSFDGDDRD